MADSSIEIQRQDYLLLAEKNFNSKEEILRRFGPGTFGEHELTHLLYVYSEQVEQYLLGSPVAALNKKAFKKIYRAQKLLCEAYQIIATNEDSNAVRH